MTIQKGDKFYFVLTIYDKCTMDFRVLYVDDEVYSDYYKCLKHATRRARKTGLYYRIEKWRNLK